MYKSFANTLKVNINALKYRNLQNEAKTDIFEMTEETTIKKNKLEQLGNKSE